MSQRKDGQLLKKLEDFASGYYYDCTRYGLSDMVKTYVRNVIDNRDYDKFEHAIANSLFITVYKEGECFKPQLVLGLIDIIVDILNEADEEKSGFVPAEAMMGGSKHNDEEIKKAIISTFNINLYDFWGASMADYILTS